MELKDKLISVINESELINVDIQLEQSPGKKVGGYITSTTFEGMPQIERQNMLWAHLEGSLNEQERSKIVAILTLTPDEVKEPKTSG